MTKLESPKTSQIVITASKTSESPTTEESKILADRSSQSNTTDSFDIDINILSISINSANVRDDKLVDFGVTIVDYENTSVLKDFIEYSLDGVNFFPATAKSLDPNHTLTFPLTASDSGTNFNYVWNAIEDIGEGTFSNVQFRIGISDG